MPATPQRITVPQFSSMKVEGHKITMLTAYDYGTAELLDGTGIEGILVGDSMSMVVQGHSTTLPVTLDEMIYHAEMVGRAVQRALVVVDLPFPSYHLGVHRAIESAGRILKQTHCQAVKLEGGTQQSEVIAGLVAAGIPVMAAIKCSETSNNYWQMRKRPKRPEPLRWCSSAFLRPRRKRSLVPSKSRRLGLVPETVVMDKS